jgi:hypothetical protein
MFTITAIAVKLNLFTFAACSSIKDVTGGSFFGLPPWWEYVKNVKVDGLGQCVPDYDFSKNFNDVLGIGLALIDILLRLAGFLAVIAIIIAGIHYIIAVGNPEKTRSARRSLVNALVGLSIAMVAVGLVKFIGTTIGG